MHSQCSLGPFRETDDNVNLRHLMYSMKSSETGASLLNSREERLCTADSCISDVYIVLVIPSMSSCSSSI